MHKARVIPSEFRIMPVLSVEAFLFDGYFP